MIRYIVPILYETKMFIIWLEIDGNIKVKILQRNIIENGTERDRIDLRNEIGIFIIFLGDR